jgi:hypothetical protein
MGQPQKLIADILQPGNEQSPKFSRFTQIEDLVSYMKKLF